MSKKRWLIFILIFFISNFLTFKSTLYIKQILDYRDLINLKQNPDKYLEFLKEDGQVYAGVAIPDKSITGNDKEDCECAKTFLAEKSNGKWLYIGKEKKFGYTAFIFQPVVDNIASKSP